MNEPYEGIEKRLDNKTGITLKEFKSFFFFLNNLESFATAIHYYALANQPIGPCKKKIFKGLNHRAVSDFGIQRHHQYQLRTIKSKAYKYLHIIMVLTYCKLKTIKLSIIFEIIGTYVLKKLRRLFDLKHNKIR